jgi:hypothetical protein
MDQNGETLPGAVIYESDKTGKPILNANSATADSNGYLIIDTSPDQYLTVKLVGYEPLTDQLKFLPYVIKLKESGNLPPVEVKATRTYYLLGTVAALILIYSAQKK